jgi:hypothetical protein
MSPGGLDRRNLIRSQFRKVRELSDVGDERACEKCGEVLDELRRERSGFDRADFVTRHPEKDCRMVAGGSTASGRRHPSGRPSKSDEVLAKDRRGRRSR